MANDTIWGRHPEVADDSENRYQGKTHHFWSIGAIQIKPFSRPAAQGPGPDLGKTRLRLIWCVFRVPTRDFQGKCSYCGDKQETNTKSCKIFQKRLKNDEILICSITRVEFREKASTHSLHRNLCSNWSFRTAATSVRSGDRAIDGIVQNKPESKSHFQKLVISLKNERIHNLANLEHF